MIRQLGIRIGNSHYSVVHMHVSDCIVTGIAKNIANNDVQLFEYFSTVEHKINLSGLLI
jgi:hypothetical protein